MTKRSIKSLSMGRLSEKQCTMCHALCIQTLYSSICEESLSVFHNNPKNQEEASAKLMISQGSSLSINYNFADILFQGTYEAAAPVERVLMPLGPMRFKMTV